MGNTSRKTEKMAQSNMVTTVGESSHTKDPPVIAYETISELLAADM